MRAATVKGGFYLFCQISSVGNEEIHISSAPNYLINNFGKIAINILPYKLQKGIISLIEKGEIFVKLLFVFI